MNVKTIPFTHDGKNYEVRVNFDGKVWQAKAFFDGKPANGFSYSISFDVEFDLQKTHDMSGIKHLIDAAQSDVKSGLWEDIAAMHSVK
jgi:hypothetical protein